MEDMQLDNFYQNQETHLPNSSISRVFEWEKDVKFDQEFKDSAVLEDWDSLVDSMLCDSNSRLIPSGFSRSSCTDELVMFINAGSEATIEADLEVKFLGDTNFEGGNVLRTDELINEAGDYQFIYQSARFGSFSYRFDNLPPGSYFVDLHFVEIINTNGPRGLRVFDVFIQEEKVLSEFDIFSVVGANKPLQLVDSRVSVKEDGVILIRFEGIIGSPVVSGLCIRKAPEVSVPCQTQDYLKCNNCATEIEISSDQKKILRARATDKYEKRIQELITECQHKSNECHEAWMSLTAANEQLEKVRMELDNKTFQSRSLDQTVGKQAENLRNITNMYERDKQYWAAAVENLQNKVKMMKEEHSRLSYEAHECADSIPELSKMVTAVQALVAQCEDLKAKYSEEQAKRKELYNQIQEAKGNIRVFCRCRPLSKAESSAGCTTVVDFDAAKDGDLGIITGGSTRKTFKFDRVFTPRDNQVDVFADASPLVLSVLDGYNVCIFAYGQTGTGKTFTMEGTEQSRGVNYRTLEQLFKIAKERSETFTYSISVSVLEVYNEQIRDLLATSPTSKKLEIKQSSEGSHHVPGIVEAKVDNLKEVWNVLQAGSNARAVGSNNVNEHSSRSHCMLCVMVKAKNLMNGECTKSKLWLVDLAGSERLAKTDVQGERLKEAQNINRSLSALGDVIYALATKSSHIPYRNSKLTHLLQDSLGGDSKTLMFVQISPTEQDVSETLSSLNFATRVRGIEFGPAKRQIDTSELQKMKLLLDKARQECKSKEESLRKLEENLQNLENKARGKDQVYKNQQEKIKELEGQLEFKSTLHSQLGKQISQLSDRLKGKEDICNGLLQKVKELDNKLRERQQSDSTAFQQKVKELENKLKEQVQESESYSFALQHKIKELERKLKEQENNSETLLLHQKIKDLEDKLNEQEKQLQCKQLLDPHDFPGSVRATPTEQKTCVRDDGFLSDIESHVLRNSNSMKRPFSQGSTLMKENNNNNNNTLHDQTRKKRQSGETENNFMQASFHDNRVRKSDPPKIGRVMTSRAARPASVAQGPLTHKRVIRDQGQGGFRERDAKKKIWC
ncbi:kinesin-like protein KIN-14R isoform X2 [Ricinus communis]|uniref:ATP binding protein, putative n=1 Tax=Ricinus communis TaxID=3988 RepID=B9T2B2_RICCO|nr:kinesin-like protein KIN-14R isoform X2 [Ricinus communis]EEF29993.1 ATP binding protein, putative [Ricinus communis]|eukprot:XP_002532381.1 kinesin-like protein KIN-14R isoform X2 [Ricinus communis]